MSARLVDDPTNKGSSSARGPLRRGLRRIWMRNRLNMVITLLLTLFLLVFFWHSMFIPIAPGEAGVKWNRLTGTVLSEVYLEGTAVIPPWDEIHVYDVRVQEQTDSVSLLTADGLLLQLHVSTRYHPVLQQLPQLHQTYGPEYHRKVIFPEVVAALRRVIGSYPPNQIYAMDEFELLDAINRLVQGAVDQRFMVVEEVLLKSLLLPPELSASIVQKLQQEQAFLEYEYRLARESAEAERKAIEAQGVADFERVSGIPILQWRGLEVTEKLAASPNSKLILIPSGTRELPIILNPPPGN